MSDRWISVGRSDADGSHEAGVEAAGEALSGPSPELLVVFFSDRHDAAEVVAGIRSASGETPLIGCSTAGEIADGGPGDAGLVVTAFGGGFEVSTGLAENASERLRDAGAEAAACYESVAEAPHSILLLLTDGLAGDQQQIVRGAYSVVGAGAPLVGGCAGDDLAMTRTLQVAGDRVLEDSVVAAAIGSEAPFGIGVRHGWRRVGEPMLVSSSAGTVVAELDGSPALDVYLERLDAPPEVTSDHRAFTEFAQSHPLGLVSRESEEHVRFIGEANFEERTITSIAEVPQGARVWLMEGDAESVLDATDAACRDALDGLDGSAARGVLAFDCIARRSVLGDTGIKTEIDRISSNVGDAPVAGFYTYGEIARTQGVSGFHNQTLVVLAVA